MRIRFAGKYLDTLQGNINILDIDIGVPALKVTTISPEMRDGQIYVRDKFGSRPVTLQLVIMEDDPDARQRIYSNVVNWARKSKAENTLYVEYDNRRRVSLQAVCTSVSGYSAKKYWEPVQIVFTAFDNPFFESEMREIELNVNGETTFYVDGVGNPAWVIYMETDTALTEPVWGLGNARMAFSRIEPGSIELVRPEMSATLDGDSLLPAMYLGSRFFDLRAGTYNTIITSGGAGGVISFSERWL